MFSKILEVVERHYILSIIILIFFCIAGVSFAASPDILKYIFASEEAITSVDNTVIVNADLDHMDVNVKINSVKVDNDSYRVDYSHDTLNLDNGFWRKVDIGKSIVVDKKSLTGQNVGAVVAKKLMDDVDSELASLKVIQAQEKNKGLTQKIVTTTYSGLIGSLLDSQVVVEENTSAMSPVNSAISGSTTSTTTPTTTEEALAEIVNNLLAQVQNPSPLPNPIPNSTPPSVAGPNPISSPSPTPIAPPGPVNPLVPTPTPSPPPSPSPSPSPTPGGYMYMPIYPPYTESPDVVNVGPVLE